MFRSTSSFDRLLERATSNLLLEPDWNAILAICDSIRSGDTPPKYAITAVKKKFYHENPHVVLYSLTVSLVATLYTFRGLIMSYFRYLSHAWKIAEVWFTRKSPPRCLWKNCASCSSIPTMRAPRRRFLRCFRLGAWRFVILHVTGLWL